MTRHDATSEQEGSAEDGAAHWLARLHSDDCDGEDLRRFVAWRESDPANGAAYDRYQRQWDMLGAMASAPGIVDLRLKALSMEPASRRFDWRHLGAIAATLRTDGMTPLRPARVRASHPGVRDRSNARRACR